MYIEIQIRVFLKGGGEFCLVLCSSVLNLEVAGGEADRKINRNWKFACWGTCMCLIYILRGSAKGTIFVYIIVEGVCT